MPVYTEGQSRTAEIEIALQFYRKWQEEHDSVDDAKDAEKAIVAQASAAGIHVKALKHAHRVVNMGTRDGKTYMDMLISYVDAISGGMLQQEEMFSNSEQIDETVRDVQREWMLDREAEAGGYAAGKNGEPVDNNAYQQGSSQHDKWARGWADGREDYIAARGTEIRPKNDGTNPEDRQEDPEDEL